jgi:hypothetical protein
MAGMLALRLVDPTVATSGTLLADYSVACSGISTVELMAGQLEIQREMNLAALMAENLEWSWVDKMVGSKVASMVGNLAECSGNLTVASKAAQ